MLTRFGDVPWTKQQMLEKLPEFSRIYANRPIKENDGGMRSPHLFALWFTLDFLKPTSVLESGVWRGQGTWFIEQACPTTKVYCLDINWRNLVYRSKTAIYLTGDLTKHEWDRVDKERTVVFLDDHMNALERCLTLRRLGFKHLMFEDNYFPTETADFYTMKLAFANKGYKAPNNLRYYAGLLRGTRSDRTVVPNDRDSKVLKDICETYQEYPPIFKIPTTRWGSAWDESLPTEEPLLSKVSEDYQQLFLDEAKWYTWICYVKLRV
jgi:hypothetical protein